jgi:HEAT repeat protein
MNERIIEQMRKMEDIHGLIKVYQNHDDEKIRLWTLEALLSINDPEVLSTFAEALGDDENEEVRSFAAQALGFMKNAHAVPVLMDALSSDPSGQVRSKAANSLGRLKNPRTLKALIAALSDEHIAVRRNSAQALGLLGDMRAEKSLLDIITQKEEDPNVYASAIKALGKLKSQHAVSELKRLLNEDPRDKILKAVIEALGWISTQECLDILMAYQLTNEKDSLKAELQMIIEKLERFLLVAKPVEEDFSSVAPLMNREKVDYKKILDRLNKLDNEH